MNSIFSIIILLSYFLVLVCISYFTGKKSNTDTFYNGNKNAPWYIVAFGMIGASLSGVTFISVPGWVENSQFGYMQMVLGYIIGYAVIGTILLPLYYKLNVTSIYQYLNIRFGKYTYKSGASLFILSRIIGASFRLYLVAKVFQIFIFNDLGVEFWQTVVITILLIWLYTFKSGIKTIIWTDTLQTLFMLIALGVTIFVVSKEINFETSFYDSFSNSSLTKIFFFNDIYSGNYFWKQFLSGAFIAIVMTGLDQDMMQKNLTCKSLKDAQKNMFWFTIVLTIANFIFLILGYLLTIYAQQNGLDFHKDNLFPEIAKNYLGPVVYMFFLLGLIAAAYSSADSALTALTTSVSLDLFEIDKRVKKEKQTKTRTLIHLSLSVILVIVITSFYYFIENESVIVKLFIYSGYTYGPLLGLYALGLFSKIKINDKLTPVLVVIAPVLTYLTDNIMSNYLNFKFGFFILLINGAFTALLLLSTKRKETSI